VADQESVRDAAIRTAKEAADLDVDAKQSLFFCEQVKPEDHRVTLFCLALPSKAVELKAGLGFSEVRWCDVRELGRIQQEEGMSDHSAEAFVKFSDYLKAQAAASAVAPMPDLDTDTTVN
jgi:ADP-ribose pyrophosphatase YjhB (NUDIX family)